MKYEQLFIANSDKYEKVKDSLKLYYGEKEILRLITDCSSKTTLKVSGRKVLKVI